MSPLSWQNIAANVKNKCYHLSYAVSLAEIKIIFICGTMLHKLTKTLLSKLLLLLLFLLLIIKESVLDQR